MLGRSLEPAREFGKRHGIRLGSLAARVVEELQPVVLVHATPVGGADRDPEERLVPEWRPTGGTHVLDMVYQPHLTRLLRDARAAGAVVVPGIDMFLAQAQEQVKLFTGRSIEAEVLRSFLAGTAASPEP
jgi:shikimate 5-dehydrogenase